MASVDENDVKAYLGDDATTYDDTSISSALAAERAAQSRVCRVPAEDALPNLREALLRRVARNLVMRRLPLGVMADDAGGIRLGSSDPEVRRLEGPYRKLVQG